MTGKKLALGRIASILLLAVGWLIAGVQTVLDLIGYATVPADAQVAAGLLRSIFLWILSIPWWVPWGFALISTLWLMRISWPRSYSTAKDAPLDQIPPPTAPTEETQSTPAEVKPASENKQWPVTSAYDLPIKLGVIDELLEIVGSEKEYEQAYREGKSLLRKWEHRIKKGDIENFIGDLKKYKEKCVSIHQRIYGIKRVNEKFVDIDSILSPKESANAGPSLNLFITAVESLRPSPPLGTGFLILRFANEFEARLKGFGKWRFELEKALLKRRKELSG